MKPVPTNSKYKTLMCRNINSPQGCSYGDRCQYAHSISELRTFVGQISQNQIENPNAQNQPAKQRNPLNYKTAKCRNFEQTGTCKYGSRCTFAHSDAEIRSRMDNLNQMNRSLPNTLMMDYSYPQDQMGINGFQMGQNGQGIDMAQLAMNGQFDPRTMFVTGMNQSGQMGGNMGQQQMGPDAMQMQGQNMQGMQNLQGMQGMQNLQGLQGMQNMQSLQNMGGIQGMENMQNIQNMQNAQNMGNMGNLNMQNLGGMQGMDNMQSLQNMGGMQGMNIQGMANMNIQPGIKPEGIFDEANEVNNAANSNAENAAINPNNNQ